MKSSGSKSLYLFLHKDLQPHVLWMTVEQVTDDSNANLQHMLHPFPGEEKKKVGAMVWRLNRERLEIRLLYLQVHDTHMIDIWPNLYKKTICL